MMRDRKTVMSWLDGLTQPDWHRFHSDSEVRNIAMESLAMLKEQPEIVRCKKCGDCREDGYCERWHISVKPEFFCADGDDGNLQEGT